MRDQWLTALRSRLRRFVNDGDSQLILAPAAQVLATSLLGTIDDPAADLEVAYAVGMFHYHRAEAMSTEDGHDDRMVAVRLLRPIHRLDPGRVPANIALLIQLDDLLAVGDAGEAPPDDVPDRGAAWFERYQDTGDLAPLWAALASYRRSFEEFPEGSTDRGEVANNIATVLRELFERTGTDQLLDEAVLAARWAVWHVGADDLARATAQTTLAGVLTREFERHGDHDVLAEALAAAREATTRVPADAPRQRAAANGALATILGLTYDRTADLSALAAMRVALRQALDDVAEEDPSKVAYATNLATALVNVYRVSGDTDALDEAIAIYRGLLDGMAPSHPGYLALQGNLGNALLSSYSRTNSMDALGDLVDAFRRATPNRSTTLPGSRPRLALLGVAHFLTFQRSGNRSELDEAVACGRLALAGASERDAFYPLLLMNLSATLDAQHRHYRDDTLTEALELVRRAVEVMPADHPARAGLLSNASTALRSNVSATRDRGTLELAITTARRAVLAAEDNDPGLALYRANLGAALSAYAEQTGRTEQLPEAIEATRLGAGQANAPMRDRLLAVHGWLATAMSAGDAREALTAARAAGAMLPGLASRSLARGDREFRLGLASGLASDAAAAALTMGRPGEALELLEQVRGVLLAEAIDARGEVATLRDREPDLAAELDRVRGRLHALDVSDVEAGGLWTSSDVVPAPTRHLAAEERLRLSGELDTVLARIRRLPGFARFLLPPDVAELLHEAAHGTIVVLNAHRHRCDAIALRTTGDLLVIPLPRLTVDAVGRHAAALADETADPRDALAWLWDTVTGPVLDALGYVDEPAPGVAWPRIWWCPTGVLARLPVHAAGRYADPLSTNANALDRVVSSYTPTIRALAHARRGAPYDPDTGRCLLVTVPDAPGLRRLAGVAAETARLDTLLPRTTLLTGESATRSRVLAELPRHALAHFACHNVTDDADPSAGGLMLTDHQQHPLSILDLSRLRLDGAYLAYLSACSTTHTNDDLLDEAVHLTGACQLAGFRQVIGTLWPVQDQSAQRVSDHFYTALTRDGTRPPDLDQVAVGLHHAVREERRRWPGQPRWWAAYINVGP